MKKIILVLLVWVMVFSSYGCNFTLKQEVDDPDIENPAEIVASEEEKLLVKDGIVKYDGEFKYEGKYPFKYYPFIYSVNNIWYNENVIGPAKCEEGYLYSKNMYTGVIKKLINVPINIFRETNTHIYFIYDNGLYCVDYEGTKIKKIYQSDEDIEEEILEFYSNFIYFIEDDNLIKLDLNNGEVKVLVEDLDDVVSLYLINDEELVYDDSEEKHHYINVKDNIYKILSELEFRQLDDYE